MTEILGALVAAPLVGVAEQLNVRLWGVEPWRIVAGTASLSLGEYLFSHVYYVRSYLLFEPNIGCPVCDSFVLDIP
jgi:hypothetical protein